MVNNLIAQGNLPASLAEQLQDTNPGGSTYTPTPLLHQAVEFDNSSTFMIDSCKTRVKTRVRVHFTRWLGSCVAARS